MSPFVNVMDKARGLVKELLDVPSGYSILFLFRWMEGLEFLMRLPINLMKKDGGKSAYLNTGTWSKKAVAEIRNFGEVIIVGDSSNENYKYIPKEYFIPEDVDYFHCTSNNTIFGTQIKDFPKVPSLMVCDMSSDIFSRKIDVSKFDLIYVGSKKHGT